MLNKPNQIQTDFKFSFKIICSVKYIQSQFILYSNSTNMYFLRCQSNLEVIHYLPAKINNMSLSSLHQSGFQNFSLKISSFTVCLILKWKVDSPEPIRTFVILAHGFSPARLAQSVRVTLIHHIG